MSIDFIRPDKKGGSSRNMSAWIADKFRHASYTLHRTREKVQECKKAITINKIPPHIQECEDAINRASLVVSSLLKEHSTSVYLDYTLDAMAGNAMVAEDTKYTFRGMRNEEKSKNESKRLEKLKRMIYKMGFNFNMSRKAKTEQQAIALLDEVIDSAEKLEELCNIAAEYVSKDNGPIKELENGVSFHEMRLGGSRKRTLRKNKTLRKRLRKTLRALRKRTHRSRK